MNIKLSRNQKIKKGIKAALEGLPLGLGSNVVIPLIRWLLAVFVYRSSIKRFRLWQNAKREAKIISKGITKGVNMVIIVYDNLASPPTYGDMFFSIMLARYFTLCDIKVTFYIVDSEYRHDWNDLDKTKIEKNNFVDEQVHLARTIINSSLAEIQRGPWSDCQELLSTLPTDSIIPFVDGVKSRVGIYHDFWILLNILITQNDDGILEKLLLTGDELKVNIDIQPAPKNPYITFGCRHSTRWGDERNLSINEFVLINKSLRKRFPNHLIMIVSDELGCEYFSSVAKKYNLECIYSKQYSSNYIGDGALILNSEFFFIFKGGGISLFPQCSKVPFENYQRTFDMLMWSKKKWASWQNREQLFFNTDLLPRHYL